MGELCCPVIDLSIDRWQTSSMGLNVIIQSIYVPSIEWLLITSCPVGHISCGFGSVNWTNNRKSHPMQCKAMPSNPMQRLVDIPWKFGTICLVGWLSHRAELFWHVMAFDWRWLERQWLDKWGAGSGRSRLGCRIHFPFSCKPFLDPCLRFSYWTRRNSLTAQWHIATR